jgi:hypothetical protein
MNALLLRNLGGLRRSSSLQSFAEYRQAEAQNPQMSSVTSEGTLLEYETLELRIHPPNVVIDNDTYDDMTVITIDSANRPGTLIEVPRGVTGDGVLGGPVWCDFREVLARLGAMWALWCYL